jgi:hypothetical protein
MADVILLLCITTCAGGVAVREEIGPCYSYAPSTSATARSPFFRT